MRGGDLDFNRQHFIDLLQGNGTSAYRNAVAINVGVLLWLADIVPTMADGVTLTLRALQTDIGFQLLQKVKEVSHAT